MRAAQAGFGFVPNMHGVMVNSPGLLDTHVHTATSDFGPCPASPQPVTNTYYERAIHGWARKKISRLFRRTA
jgi:hypothetical protein